MMNFNSTPEQTSFEMVPEGEYEVFVERAEERPTNNGTLSLSIRLKIRDDIPQPCQNRLLFLNIYKKKQPNNDDLQVDSYNYMHLYHLLDVTGVFDSGKEFDSMADICRILVGRELRVTVHYEIWNGTTREKIDQLKGVNESDPDVNCSTVGQNLNPAYDMPFAPPDVSASNSIEDFEEIISNEDVPF